MSFDYGSNDRDRDRDHSDRRGQGGYNNDRDGGYGGGRTAVHDSYERDRENAREAGYDNRGYGDENRGDRRGDSGGSYGDDGGSSEYNSQSRRGYGNDDRRDDNHESSSHNHRNEEKDGDYRRGDYGSKSNHDNDQSGHGYQDEGYGCERNRRDDYGHKERQGFGDSSHRQHEGDERRETYSSGDRQHEDTSNNSDSAAYHNNKSRDSHTGNLGLAGSGKSGEGAINWQTVGTQVAIAGIQHFAKSYDKSSSINKEEQRKFDEADGTGGSQAKDSAFARKLGERKGETEKLGHEAGDVKDKLVEGGLGFLKGAFGSHK